MKNKKNNLDDILKEDEVDSILNELAKKPLLPSMIHLADELDDPDVSDVIKKAAIGYTLMDIIKFYNLNPNELGIYNETVRDVIRGMVTGDYSLAYNNLYSLNYDLENQGGINGKLKRENKEL